MSTEHDGPDADRDVPVRGIDRFLAFGALGVAALSIVCFFAIIIGTAAGMDQQAFGTGAWPVVAAVPMYGLPLAFVMIIALLVMSFIRKGRASSRS
ncbi:MULTISPECIES: multidrug ABC transporter ATPase [Microbacterium]|uniref:multidrug ABC transporter ATPase n=1 Tax=Microbacterium TaxID=33882 RepID=UPI00217DED75|nr:MULTISPECIES: multidrug ABC transporter ATPase [Microbacterium]UWF77039.1 multidrug ABC transporter ATPase [Microbacterium neungamense]WCM55199.1 multidrug ABC transporter ATPase [Microbacterium sp. EF45047]